MVLKVTSKKTGKSYFLHRKGDFYYFSRDKKGALDDIPDNKELIELESGLPALRSVR